MVHLQTGAIGYFLCFPMDIFYVFLWVFFMFSYEPKLPFYDIQRTTLCVHGCKGCVLEPCAGLKNFSPVPSLPANLCPVTVPSRSICSNGTRIPSRILRNLSHPIPLPQVVASRTPVQQPKPVPRLSRTLPTNLIENISDYLLSKSYGI